jgi:hypothetical protein
MDLIGILSVLSWLRPGELGNVLGFDQDSVGAMRILHPTIVANFEC